MTMVPVECFFVLSALLFFIGVFGFITRRDLIAMLISVELVLNSVDLNFAVFNRILFPGQFEGFFFTLFSIGVSAAETAVAVAIIINVYRHFHSDQVNSIENMKLSLVMDYSYVYLILLLPLFSFLILGLAGMKMSHKTAGLIGTTSLGIVTVLSYLTAITYFTGERAADGTFATIVPFNFTWLPLGNLHFDLGFLIDPISAMMLIVISTVSLPFFIHNVNAWLGCCNQYLPDVSFLGACGCKFIPAYRILLSYPRCCCCI